jgi:YaiO family outer membrane protein
MRRAGLLVAACAPLGAFAEEAPQPPFEVRAEAQRENLDHGQPDWREELLQFAWKPRRDTSLSAGARATERFDLKDREGFAAAYVPIAGRTVLHLEGSASSTHHVLPKGSGLAEIAIPFGTGWVGSIAGKYARYDTGNVRMASGTLEKYVGDYRLAYTGYLSRPEGAGWTPAHRFAASWYRGTLTFITLSYATGREVESLPGGLLVTDVRGASLVGGYELQPNWGITLELGQVRQGDLYTRRGVRIGTRVLF